MYSIANIFIIMYMKVVTSHMKLAVVAQDILIHNILEENCIQDQKNSHHHLVPSKKDILAMDMFEYLF